MSFSVTHCPCTENFFYISCGIECIDLFVEWVVRGCVFRTAVTVVVRVKSKYSQKRHVPGVPSLYDLFEYRLLVLKHCNRRECGHDTTVLDQLKVNRSQMVRIWVCQFPIISIIGIYLGPPTVLLYIRTSCHCPST